MTLKLFIHDVGHGHAVHAFTPNGQSIVIDLGCSEEFSPLSWLREQTDTIDSLIITHPHGDHIDEILQLEDFKVRQIWRPKWLPEDDVRKANQSSYTEKLDYYFDISNNRFIHPTKNEKLVGNPDVSSGVTITKHASRDCGTSNINNHSGVVVFEYCGVKVVIPGDNELPSWKSLLSKQNFVDAINGAHLYLSSHHGRESGYHSDLFKIIKPKLCVVSDGRVQNTDAAARYSQHAGGWSVSSKSTGNLKERSCLTTRTDGYIEIEIGKNDDGSPYMSVTTP
ncbi:putative hydrolase (metallo-beta-lactamase superfamily) [Desulfocapsa sulfexigens DSM 10523]|uniref:Putative hydrolase (Metallo-beta-lactamase superfamily) n=1 Tax=Desulfocapsa sulfexigens (strain DSM 10523 / SB164P1) TaxID=1167006 RepID=M1PJV8_DESSD|nr:MBL fold metallo-hydrolase [Desulfocapsa sulfexigens]AGF76801.1 putative hydrolase (metallo-beta-lactamase superfamily) [Desulfocapsa sulfexigens DSM 10523]